jgi:ribose/xylose/arabinose/galactoside ABC-type transport system permease subunit
MTEAEAPMPRVAEGIRSYKTQWQSAFFRVGGLTIGIVLVMALFAVLNENFLSHQNLLGLVRSMSTLAIVALGLTLVLIAGELDLSVGAVYGLGAMAMGVLMVDGMPALAAFALAIGVGALVGLTNATLVVFAGIPAFIVTLGMVNIVQGFTFLISDGRGLNPAYGDKPVSGTDLDVFRALGGSELPFGIPIQIAWLVGISVLIWLLLDRSMVGFRLKALGGNVTAARAAGLRIRAYKFGVFAISGALAALAGILDFSYVGSTEPSAGAALLFQVFAAVIIGGASLYGGVGSVIGTLAGCFLLAALANGIALLGLGVYAQLFFIGTVTIVAVALDQWSARRRRLLESTTVAT